MMNAPGLYGRFETARAFQVDPSLRLRLWLPGVHVLGICLLLILLPGLWLVAAAPLLAWSGVGAWQRHEGRLAIRRLVRGGDGEWHLQLASGGWQRGHLCQGSLVLPALTVLNFRADRWRGSVVILGDNMSPAARRRLRVIMRYAGSEEVAP